MDKKAFLKAFPGYTPKWVVTLTYTFDNEPDADRFAKEAVELHGAQSSHTTRRYLKE